MSPAQVALLGVIAGFTIYLGLPLGRLRARMAGLRVATMGAAIGILVFLLWDVLTAVIHPVEESLEHAAEGEGSWSGFVLQVLILVAGLAVALVGLAAYERWMNARAARTGPGAATVGAIGETLTRRSEAGQLALLIAIGIGLHNFAEGLAIGQSAASGATELAVLLVVGFALHNATEGFGIVGPMTGEGRLPTWGFLGVLGLIGGGPTFLGTLVGQAVVSEPLSIAFLSLGAGSILYVVLQLTSVARRATRPVLLSTAVVVGFVIGLATDFFLEVFGGG